MICTRVALISKRRCSRARTSRDSSSCAHDDVASESEQRTGTKTTHEARTCLRFVSLSWSRRDHFFWLEIISLRKSALEERSEAEVRWISETCSGSAAASGMS